MTAPFNSKIKEALAYNRDKSAPGLPFLPRIDVLIDSDHCQQVSDALVNKGSNWSKLDAGTNMALHIPDQYGLYMFVWIPELKLKIEEPNGTTKFSKFPWCLYVGKAQNSTLKARFTSEYQKYIDGNPSDLWEPTQEKREVLLRTYLPIRPLQYWFLPVHKPADTDELERKLIYILQPPLNLQRKIRASLAQKPIPAF